VERGQQEVLDGLAETLAETFEKILRPKGASGETEPMGTVEVKLSKETKQYLGMLVGGGILLNVVGNAVASNLIKKK